MDPVENEVVSSTSDSDTDLEPGPKRLKLGEEGQSVRLIAAGTLKASQSYVIDSDFDINEIPSDLEFSPPRRRRRSTRSPDINTPRHRQRRGAIFERRSPPPVNIEELQLAQVYQDEFEVASDEINENPIEDVNSTSGSDSEAPVPVQNKIEVPPGTNENSQDADSSQEILSENEKSEALSDDTHKSSGKSKGAKSTDSEISEKDNWTCSMCHCRTQPHFRFCGRCFNMRRGWLPERPKSRNLKRRNRKKAQQRRTCRPFVVRRIAPVTPVSSEVEEGEDCVDGPKRNVTQDIEVSTTTGNVASTSQARTEEIQAPAPIIRSLPTQGPLNFNEAFIVADNHPSLDRINSRTPPGNVTILDLELFAPPPPPTRPIASSSGATTTTEVESSSRSSQSQPQPSEPETYSQPMSTQSSTSDMSPPDPRPSSSSRFVNEIPPSNQCNMCSVRVKNAIFVHSKTGHQYACYNCSKMIFKRSGKCPVCRDKVHRVVKVFVV